MSWTLPLLLTFLPATCVEEAAEHRVIKENIGSVRITIDSPPARLPMNEPIEYQVTMLGPADVEVRWPRHMEAQSNPNAKVQGTRTIGPDRIEKFIARRWFLRFDPIANGPIAPGQIVVETRIGKEPWTSKIFELPTVEIMPPTLPYVPQKTGDLHANDSPAAPTSDFKVPYFFVGSLVLAATLLGWGWLRWRQRAESTNRSR